MSINMTQEFVFETDDLVSFELMLRCIGEILFRKPLKTLNIKTKCYMGEHGWPSGAEFAEPQKIFGPVGTGKDQYSVVEPDGIYSGVWVEKPLDHRVYDKDTAAKVAKGLEEENRPATRMLIATVDEWEAKEEDVVCSGLGDLFDKLMKIVRETDPKKFLEEFGDGFNYGFNRNDGSIAHGYRMEWRPSGGADLLHISMVHAYYGK